MAGTTSSFLPRAVRGAFCTQGSPPRTSEAVSTAQAGRLAEWATQHDCRPDEVVKEIGSGLNGNRRQLRRTIGDPSVGTIIVEHRERLCRFGFEYIEAALSARGARILVVDDGEVEDDLVRDATEVMTSLCARLYGKRSARRRAGRAVAAAGEL